MQLRDLFQQGVVSWSDIHTLEFSSGSGHPMFEAPTAITLGCHDFKSTPRSGLRQLFIAFILTFARKRSNIP
jgi:hypothetical protein